MSGRTGLRPSERHEQEAFEQETLEHRNVTREELEEELRELAAEQEDARRQEDEVEVSPRVAMSQAEEQQPAQEAQTVQSSDRADQLADAFARLRSRFPNEDSEVLISLAREQILLTNPSITAAVSKDKTEIEIPRHIQSGLMAMTKLCSTNWHTWARDFCNQIMPLKGAVELLFNEEEPEDTQYMRELDRQLSSVVYQTLDSTSSRNIRYLMDSRKEWRSGRQLTQYLKSKLQQGDQLTGDMLLVDLNRIRLYGNDLERAIHDIESIVSKARQVDVAISETQMCSVLLAITQRNDPLQSVWSHLRISGKARDWTAVSTEFRAWQLSNPDKVFSRQQRATVLAVSSSNQQQSQQSQQNQQNQQLPEGVHSHRYLEGKRNPKNPSAPAVCFLCDLPGHVAKVCPNPKPGRTLKGNQTNEFLCYRCDQPGHIARNCTTPIDQIPSHKLKNNNQSSAMSTISDNTVITQQSTQRQSTYAPSTATTTGEERTSLARAITEQH